MPRIQALQKTALDHSHIDVKTLLHHGRQPQKPLQLAAERARLAVQERQQAYAWEQVAEQFRTIAARREARAHGYGDHSSDWRAAPEALRNAVDAYNEANQHTKDLYIERIQREPQMAHAMRQLLHDRERVLQRDRDQGSNPVMGDLFRCCVSIEAFWESSRSAPSQYPSSTEPNCIPDSCRHQD